MSSTCRRLLQQPTSQPLPSDSYVVVILAALLCALICVIGLALVARCAWIRRNASSSSFTLPQYSDKGIKKNVLKALPKLTFRQTLSDDRKLSSDCAICLTDFAEGDSIRALPQCGHGFHVKCVDTWLKLHSSCPSCRRILVRPMKTT